MLFKRLKSQSKGLRKKGGRNHTGKITFFHRGGGHKRAFRKIHFLSCFGSSLVESLEYDPNRSAIIARLFSNVSKKHFYIVAPKKIEVGSFFQRSFFSNFFLGSSGFLYSMPLGSLLHCIGTRVRVKQGILQRAAGSFGQLVEKGKKGCVIRLSSGKTINFLPYTFAILGVVSNPGYSSIFLKKAGVSRRFGVTPTVRGVAMNPVDHPHGGGEGKTSGGRPSVTPWAKPAHHNKTKK
jgi:large subunit ribosomal protein L2